MKKDYITILNTYDGSQIWHYVYDICTDRGEMPAFYNIPTSGGDMNSFKYVQGALDTDFSRFPQIGNTNLNGDGVYEIIISNDKFEDVTAVYVMDAGCMNTVVDTYTAPAACAVCPPARCGTINRGYKLME